jgi:hypothetical protein
MAIRRFRGWGGQSLDDPWADVELPFELLTRDREDYPAATGRLLKWIKEQDRPWITRGEASRIARRVGLADRQHRPELQRRCGMVYDALEILTVYDYLRMRCHHRLDSRYYVNPQLLAIPSGMLIVVDPTPPVLDPKRNFSSDQKRELWFFSGGRCGICRVGLPPNWHADHVIPWILGGTTTLDNGMALCPRCNMAKNARMPEGRR